MSRTSVPLQRVSHYIDSFSEWTGRAISWLTFAMVLVTFLVVVLRYAFNVGWIAMQESVTYMHALVFMLAAAFTLKRNGHVRVDIFYRQMGKRSKAVVDLVGTLFLLLPTCIFIFWVSLQYVGESWAVHEGSREAGGLPYVYLLKSTIVAMPLLLIAQGISSLINCLIVLLGRQPLNEED